MPQPIGIHPMRRREIDCGLLAFAPARDALDPS
jgi:hypothetical protein